MCRNSIITLLIIIWIHERCAFASPKNISVCFGKQPSQNNDSWCQQYLILCDDASFAYNISVYMRSFPNSGSSYSCENCKSQSTDPLNNSYPNFPSTCYEKRNCSLDHIPVPSTDHGGILTWTFVCNNTDDDKGADNSTTTDGRNKPFPNSSSVTSTSKPTTMNINTLTEDSESSIGNNTTTARVSTDSPTTAIVVSVVIPAIIAVVVVAVMMNRRGKCKLWFVKCMKMYDKHTDTVDAYDMSSRGNVNLTNDLSRGVDVNVCDVDYCEIDNVGKETDVEYSHVNLEKKQAVQDPTYNHIEHFDISSGNAEQTYNHVGDETLRITE